MTGILNHEQTVEVTGYITSLIAVVQSVNSSTKEEFAQKFQGVIRHILTFMGSLGLLKGWFATEDFTAIVGALTVAGGTIWSVFSKKGELPPAS